MNGLDPTTVANLKLKTCSAGTNYTLDACSSFCTAKTGDAIPINNTSTDALTSGNTIKDGCNTLYASKCSTDSSPAVCGCQRPWASFAGSADIPDKAMYVKDPACYFNACRNFGYFSKPLAEHGCPSCVQYQQLTATGSDIALNNIVQSCNTNGFPPTAAPTSAPVAAQPASQSSTASLSPASSTKSNSGLILAAIFGFIIFLGLMSAILTLD